jgi:hypothetical protein
VQSYRIALRKLHDWEILAAPSGGTIWLCRIGAIRQDCVQFALANCNAALFRTLCLQHGVSVSLLYNIVKSFTGKCQKKVKIPKKTSKIPEKTRERRPALTVEAGAAFRGVPYTVPSSF